MTNDTSRISLTKQILWYYKNYKIDYKNGKMICYIFRYNGKKSGDAVFRKVSGKFLITGGLRKNERGKGLGKLLFTDLIQKVPSSNVFLEVLETNTAAKNIQRFWF